MRGTTRSISGIVNDPDDEQLLSHGNKNYRQWADPLRLLYACYGTILAKFRGLHRR